MYVLEFPDDRVTSKENRVRERSLLHVVYPELNSFVM